MTNVILPGGNIWLQDADVIHASLFHASHHLTPVPVSEEEVRSTKLKNSKKLKRLKSC